MTTHIGTKNGTKEALEEKLNEIREDLIFTNAKDLLNRREHFTRKYRGNRLSDVNVGIWEEPSNYYIVQIFVRNKAGYKREQYKLRNIAGGITEVDLGYGK